VTEDEARDWIAARYGAGRLAILERYVSLLLAGNREQNLISKASEPHVWVRHILDSAQLARLAPDAADWLDIGSGPGLPGLVLACLTDTPMLLVEPRRKRAEFLVEAADALGLSHVRVRQAEIEKVGGSPVGAVTARAFAGLETLFASTVRLTDASTTWVLPKGRSAEQELVAARRAWQGVFHVEQSLTDADARIIVARGVRART
jgi:16S rRNA (guanine527-N7)-methyltransferase